jgi:hypothetical protein
MLKFPFQANFYFYFYIIVIGSLYVDHFVSLIKKTGENKMKFVSARSLRYIIPAHWENLFWILKTCEQPLPESKNIGVLPFKKNLIAAYDVLFKI